VPQRQRQAEALPVVADPGESVLPPAVGPAAGLVVGQVVPGVPVGAVVLAHGAPLPLAEVRPPLPPGLAPEAVLLQALPLLIHRLAPRCCCVVGCRGPSPPLTPSLRTLPGRDGGLPPPAGNPAQG